MFRDEIARRRVLFLGGKGGVGKTTSAAAVALDQARAGRRVLLVSTDPAHNLGHLWGRKIGEKPVVLHPGLDAVEIDPDREADRHFKTVGQHLYGMMPEHLHGEVRRYLQVSAQAPGAHEAAMLERTAQLTVDGLRDYDLVVFDTAPSGHTARLLALPEMMAQWTRALLDNRTRADRFGAAARSLDGGNEESGIGARRSRDQRIRELLERRQTLLAEFRTVITDPKLSGFIIVLAAERMPVLETLELRKQLAESNIAVIGYLINKRTPDAADSELLATRHAAEEHWVAELRKGIGRGALIVQTPLLAHEPIGEAALAEFGGMLFGGPQ
ncbi:ArsA family ATPase [Gulosibacter hominis]|uniref:ArsA family ATPase n=1 Tax=Gulosibacter hominis TaxID=2770504 RepID=UPI0019193985|nr:ArsA family ATPase [Gulosibacter hominis]